MTSLDAVINLQISRATLIEESLSDTKKTDASQLGVSALESIFDILLSYWEQFEVAHERLIASSAKVEGLLGIPYFKTQVFDKTLATFRSAKVALAQVRDLCAAGGMPLAKWHGNSPALLKWLDPDCNSNDHRVYEDSGTRILGVSWQPSSDNFVVSSQTSVDSKVFKRNILSEIAPIYDPLGFLSSVVIRGKLLMQETWIGKLGWDEEVPEQVAQCWKDTSVLPMSVAVYLKVFNGNEEPRISLVCSRKKVVSLERLTIPRLELTVAVLLTKLVKYVKDQLNFSEVPISRHISSSGQFHRGLRKAHRRGHLYVSPVALADLEEKPGVVFNAKVQRPEIWDIVHRYSSLIKLLRVTAICQRFISRLKKVPGSSLKTSLNPGDIEQAQLFWIKTCQSAHFSTELTTWSRGQKLNASHPLTRLTVFLDCQGVLRVGGRLKFAQLDGENKHPVILPKESQLAQLIMEDAYLRTLHGGTQLTHGQLRQSYWILRGRAPVRSFILKCVPCAR
ncbi:uncharacterized protein LOC107045162 [Diachasma alloeum]|uniref:uncharacterized protein LOC107045162 n=1 Tax=Diachasma alloeum TaxID=454923 RepID=UPI0007383C32|nr:uncharacterized protein LOC107045162 [Diachasma alloeum]